eukprot:3546269-Rhodomonas_salina.3
MPNDPFLFLQATKEECNELLRSLTPAETSILNPLISSVVSLCPAIEDSRKRFKRLSTSYATTIREVESMQTHMHDIHTNVTKCTATNEPLQHDDAAPQDATDRLDELLTEDIFNKNSSMDDEHITPEIHITKTARRVRASSSLLRVNKDLLGSDIDEQTLIDNQWYKVSRQVLSSCCNTLRSKVLSRVATRDLNSFSVQLHSIGNDNWGDLGDGTEFLQDMPQDISWEASQRQTAEAKWMELQMKKPCSYMATLELEYEVQA